MIELTLPYPPSVNHYKIGRTHFNSEKTKRYFYEVWMKCRQEGFCSLQDSTISLTLWVYPPDNRKRDLDNICKVLIDSLVKAGCFNDDSQVSRLLVERMYTIKHGQIICRIEPL